MSTDELENYEADQELQLYREYRDVVGLFTYVVETDRRFYLAFTVDRNASAAVTDVYFELPRKDPWFCATFRSALSVKHILVLTFKDVNIEEIAKSDLELPTFLRR